MRCRSAYGPPPEAGPPAPNSPCGAGGPPLTEHGLYDVEDGMVKRALAEVAVMVAAGLLLVAGCGRPLSHAVPHPSPNAPPCAPR